MRWLLLDEILVIERKVKASARSHVPSSEFSPEILMMEMMAQTGALLLGAETDYQEDLVFAKIEEASFNAPVKENQVIYIHARPVNLRREGAQFEAWIENESEKIAEARFLLMSVGHLIPEKEEPVTFHKVFMDYFRIREKIK